MPIKGIFTGNNNHENFEERILALEKEVKRINTLDVTMKRFLRIEGKMNSFSKEKMDKNTSLPKETQPRKETGQKDFLDKAIMEQVKQLVSVEVKRHIHGWDNLQEQMSQVNEELSD